MAWDKKDKMGKNRQENANFRDAFQIYCESRGWHKTKTKQERRAFQSMVERSLNESVSKETKDGMTIRELLNEMQWTLGNKK